MAEPLPLCYLNGAYLPLTQARISPLDRGFLYGDAVYELMPVYRGRPFRFAAHAERLVRSLAGIAMEDPHSREEWRAILGTLIERNGGHDCYVYWQVSRGAQLGRTHAPLPLIPRTVFAFCAPWPSGRFGPHSAEEALGRWCGRARAPAVGRYFRRRAVRAAPCRAPAARWPTVRRARPALCQKSAWASGRCAGSARRPRTGSARRLAAGGGPTRQPNNRSSAGHFRGIFILAVSPISTDISMRRPMWPGQIDGIAARTQVCRTSARWTLRLARAC